MYISLMVGLLCCLNCYGGICLGIDLDSFFDAIGQVESGGDCRAIGDDGKAVGKYQIHKDYWQDGIRLLDVDWNYKDAFDPGRSRKVVRAYLLYYGRGKGLFDMARIHNGGPKGVEKAATVFYARRVFGVLLNEAEAVTK